MKFFTRYCGLALLAAMPNFCFAQATYRIDFDVAWSAANHPGAWPASAHFSPLVGTTHDASTTFWEPGGIASPGIEQMAETGGTSTLRGEFSAATGRRGGHLLSTTIFGPGRRTIEFDVDKSESLVTFVTMVAPSPDWFVGVSGLDLYDGGTWADGLVVDLFAWDAGTDSGSSFTSGNLDTNPQEPIALLDNPLSNLPALGTFTFTLLSVPEPSSALLVTTILFVAISRRQHYN